MWDILESAKVDAFIVPELAVAHVSVVLDDFANMLWWQVLRPRCKVRIDARIK